MTFTIVIDTREQAPFAFAQMDVSTEHRALATGDYSISGLEDKVTVERKSLIDLFGSCGWGRTRFEAEIERMAAFQHAAIVCEADWQTILRNPPGRCRLNPKAIFASIVAWNQRYGVHFWPCVNRAFAEKATYRILERFYRDFIDRRYSKGNSNDGDKGASACM